MYLALMIGHAKKKKIIMFLVLRAVLKCRRNDVSNEKWATQWKIICLFDLIEIRVQSKAKFSNLFLFFFFYRSLSLPLLLSISLSLSHSFFFSFH